MHTIIAVFYFLTPQYFHYSTGRNTLLEQIKLPWFIRITDLFFPVKGFHSTKLFVRNRQNTNFSVVGQKRPDSSDVDIGVFAASTVPHIDRELMHGEAVLHQVFAKLGVGFFFEFGLGR
jgi:hypothetical protein